MNWNAVLTAAFAAIVGLTALIRDWTATQGLRTRIKQEMELLDRLPDSSSMRDELAAHIDRGIAQLVGQEQEERRDPGGIVLALFLAAFTTWTIVRGVDGTDLWFVATAILGLLTIAGFAISVPKVRRDERGRALKESPGP